MRNRPWLKWVLIGVGVVVILRGRRPLRLHQLHQEDAPPKLSLSDVPTATTTAEREQHGRPAGRQLDRRDVQGHERQPGRVPRRGGAVRPEARPPPGAPATSRVQSVIAGTTVSKADFTVGLATVKSDEDRRDNQFQGRIMDVADVPTATFTLTQPIELPSIPRRTKRSRSPATGDLTLRGVTKPVTFELTREPQGFRHHRGPGQHPDHVERLGDPGTELRPGAGRRQR